MLDRSIVEPTDSKSAKRPHDATPKQDVSPKLRCTPRTRSKVSEEITPSHLPLSTRAAGCKGAGPVLRTPIDSQRAMEKETPMASKLPVRTPLRTPRTSKKEIPITSTLPVRTPVATSTTSSTLPIRTPICTSRTSKKENATPSTLNVPKTRITRSRSNTPISSTKRCRSMSPMTEGARSRTRRSRSKTPIIPKSRSSSRTPHVKPTVSKRAESSSVTSATLKLGRLSPAATKSASKDKVDVEKPSTTPRTRKMNLTVDQETPRISRSRPSSSRIFEQKTPQETNSIQQKSETPCEKSSNAKGSVKDDLKKKQVTKKKDEGIECISEKDACDPMTNNDERPSSVSDMEEISPQAMCMDPSTTDSSARECTEELNKEVERVKKRRSTLGRGRRSGVGFVGRQSICSAMPTLSLEDQISNIDKSLPQTSKVSYLLDIALREAMRRLAEDRSEDCIPDLRLELVTNSETVGGHAAFKIAGMPLEIDGSVAGKLKEIPTNSSNRATLLKNKTKALEQEYKCWKSLLRERKAACQVADREFREAKSGETKIEEDSLKSLTSIQRNILSAKPDYSNYIKEVQMAREKSSIIMQEINSFAQVISNFLKASKAVADSCYAAVEEMTFGPMKPVKSALNTLLIIGEVPST